MKSLQFHFGQIDSSRDWMLCSNCNGEGITSVLVHVAEREQPVMEALISDPCPDCGGKGMVPVWQAVARAAGWSPPTGPSSGSGSTGAPRSAAPMPPGESAGSIDDSSTT